MVADRVGVSTVNVEFWLTPWRRTDEHLPLSHIAEVTTPAAWYWDASQRRKFGRAQPAVRRRAAEGPARYFVEHVRERLNETAVPLSRNSRRAEVSCPAIAKKDGGVRRRRHRRAVEDRPSRPAEIATFSPSLIARRAEFGQRILHVFLDHALERARAIGRIVALLGQPLARLGVERQRDLAVFQKLLQPLIWISTMRPICARLSLWNRMISSMRFRNSGRKRAAHLRHHLLAHLRRYPRPRAAPPDIRRRGWRS